MFGHANTTHLGAEEATNACPSATLAHATGSEQLCRVCVTGRDLYKRKILLLLSRERLLTLPPTPQEARQPC